MFYSATGLMCLSLKTDAEVRRLFEHDDVDPQFQPSQIGLTWDDLQARLNHVRTVGYGMRIAKTVIHDKLLAIALPIYRQGDLWGGVPLLWPKVFMTTADFADKYLDDLRETVSAIQADIDKHDSRLNTRQGPAHGSS
ncbi:IclR family transcriptional regulator C-terminal domain-containing protein [Shimia sp.]|uniref:IclR family transcriptional regulator domain-containing protein n=1 Tax=Shimia sp. TaxID=1954381 RepID=UPI003298A763